MAYTGTVAEVPLGYDGLTGTKNLATAKPSQLLRARNLTYENGTLQKEGGTSKYNTTAITGAPTIQGGHDWWPSEGVQRMVVACSDGKVYKDDGAATFATTLVTGLTMTSVVPVFVEGGSEAGASNRKLFLFTGKNAVKVLSADGATMTTITTPPADWSGTGQPISGCVHEGRLWGFKNHIAYYSRTTDHEDFTGSGSGSILIYPGEGEKIMWGEPFGPFIIVAKFPRGLYAINTSDPTVANWKVQHISGDVGVASPRAGTDIDSDVMFQDTSGDFYLLSTFSEQADIRNRNLGQIADLGPYLRENLALGQLGKAQMIYYGAKRRVEVANAGTGQTVNTTRMVVDLNRQDLPRFRQSDLVTCEALWLRKDANGIPRPVAGDNAGFVRLLDQDSRSHDSAGYQGEFQTTYTDFGYVDAAHAVRRKNFAFLELHVEPKGDWDLHIDVNIDGQTRQTIDFSMGGSGAVLGTWEIGTHALGGDQVLSKRKRMIGSGRRLSLVGRNSGDGQDFSIAKAMVSYTLGDERG